MPVLGSFDDSEAVWRQCEIAWSTWLQQAGHAVVHMTDAVGNHPRTSAPMMAVGGKAVRAPDLMSAASGTTTYWEVKYRSRSEVDSLTGDREHWMSYASFQDYLDVAEGTGSAVCIALYEAGTSTTPGRWLQANVQTLLDVGREDQRVGRGGDEVAAWAWPAMSMEVISGPRVDVRLVRSPLLPDEGSVLPLEPQQLQPVERRLRKVGMHRPADAPPPDDEQARVERALTRDPFVGLEVLRLALGIPSLPRYSVLRLGADGIDVSGLLGLLHYGIRVFLVSGPDVQHDLDPDELEAFKASRLLEWAQLSAEPSAAGWVVDGQPGLVPTADLDAALLAADVPGGINTGQYCIVHADAHRDVLVTAGAGTGKTETMAERLVFLLSTVGGGGSRGAEPDLRADEVALVTFSRDAAREMRSRLARTLMLRRRLCPSSVQPLAWLLQLSGAEVSTIHALAKRVVREGGAQQGLSPRFSVSKLTMPFRGLVMRALSDHLLRMIKDHPADSVPAAHVWLDHITQVWESLANNGVDLLRLGHAINGEPPAVDWGDVRMAGLSAEVSTTTRRVIEEVAGGFRELCLREDALPTGQLVPTALAALRGPGATGITGPRYLFVDEFQDTDALQMDLLLEMSQKLGARLFVVGDAKQGIYRFRGAEGNAFTELRSRVHGLQREHLVEFPLTRNFRSGEALLNSLHPLFENWGEEGLLPYAPDDRLRANTDQRDSSQPVEARKVPAFGYEVNAASEVMAWRQQHPGASIAVLCRLNSHALKVQRAIREANGSCELRVGGHFFRTEAVRELRVLLDAVSDPEDDASLLELMETRWAAAILDGQVLPSSDPADAALSRGALPAPRGWDVRLGTLSPSASFDRADLARLRMRVHAIAATETRMPVMEWIVECVATFLPEACERQAADDVVERRRYARCLDHLTTLLDAQFADAAVSLERIQSWLRLQIATNRSEDEPTDAEALEGRTTALTVHKAKGLEFDMVLIPHTWTPFGPPPSIRTRTAVLKPEEGDPRLLWEWRDKGTFSNVGPGEGYMWQTDKRETAREETRLLYVALTRARERAVVALSQKAPPASASDGQSWQDLLLAAGLRE